MGEHAAEAERSRLELGIAPIRDMAELVESQGIPVIKKNLEDHISGIFIANSETQLGIIINEAQLDRAKARVAFTIAHEYSHILLDRDKGITISKISNDRPRFIRSACECFCSGVSHARRRRESISKKYRQRCFQQRKTVSIPLPIDRQGAILILILLSDITAVWHPHRSSHFTMSSSSVRTLEPALKPLCTD